MLALFIFRRYGFIAPLTVLLTGATMQFAVDQKYGADYFLEHFWSIGLCLFISGLITGTIVYNWLDPPSWSSRGAYSTLDSTGFLPKTTQDVVEAMSCDNCWDSAREFVSEPSEQDHFCYVPLNWCAVGLVGLGTVLFTVGMFQS